MKKLMILILLLCGSASACDGHFENQVRNVQVCGAHYERVWLGYWATVYVPCRYERQVVQVWIPERRGGGSFNLGVTWNWHTW